MAQNILPGGWGTYDRSELQILFEKHFGGHGQYSPGQRNRFMPVAGKECRIEYRFKGRHIVEIEPGAAFDKSQWKAIVDAIEKSISSGPERVGRNFSFSSRQVRGSWRGAQSGVQILPPLDGAPTPDYSIADHPFILEFLFRASDNDELTRHRRIEEHRKLTLLLNCLLAGGVNIPPLQSQHGWALIKSDEMPLPKWIARCPYLKSIWEKLPFRLKGTPTYQSKYVQQGYWANLGRIVDDDFSTPSESKILEVESDAYYAERGDAGQGLQVPSDLDDSIALYRSLTFRNREKYDRALYWMDLYSRQWAFSASASYASLVSAIEALTENSEKHTIHCPECKIDAPHGVTGLTKNFHSFLEKYIPGESQKKRRVQMYDLRSKILHGSDLMHMDSDWAFGWDPKSEEERSLHGDLWIVARISLRNWLKNPPP